MHMVDKTQICSLWHHQPSHHRWKFCTSIHMWMIKALILSLDASYPIWWYWWFFWGPTLDLLNTVTHPSTHKNLHFDVVNVLIVCSPTCWTLIRRFYYSELADDVRGEFRPRQTRQLPRVVDLKGRLLSCQSY